MKIEELIKKLQDLKESGVKDVTYEWNAETMETGMDQKGFIHVIPTGKCNVYFTYYLKEFQRKKLVVSESISVGEIETGRVDDDFIKNEMTLKLEAYIFEKTLEERTVYFICRKPTFLDWLLGRERHVEFKVDFREIKSGKDTFETYYIKEVE